MSFESQIQQWVSFDNQLKILNEKAKDLREKRSSLEKNITTHAYSNNLSDSIIQISDGKLKFATTRAPEPLTFKYLEKSLKEIITNDAHVKVILDHIKKKRDVKEFQEIKRFSNN